MFVGRQYFGMTLVHLSLEEAVAPMIPMVVQPLASVTVKNSVN